MGNTNKVTLDGRIRFEGNKCFFIVNPHEDYNEQYRILLGHSLNSNVTSMNNLYDYRSIHCLKSTYLNEGEIAADIIFSYDDLHTNEYGSRSLKSGKYTIRVIDTNQLTIWDIS